jgi:SpoVK/Ycf46/Vps4 family AAA+-type ATPase
VDNPLRGLLPILQQPVATREEIRAVLRATSGAPALQDYSLVLDALAGLTCAAAEQVAAESIIASDFAWVPSHLRAASKAALRDGGLEIRPTVQSMGGLANLQEYFAAELIPFAHDSELGDRRLLFAGIQGTGKSYGAAALAGKIGCECAELSPERCKAGIVGASGANFRRALRTIDALAKDAPIVVLIDEIDLLATDGLDGGASSGMFSELCGWLDNSDSLAIVVATLNRADKLSARLDSRFPSKWSFDLPCAEERREIAEIHLTRLSAANPTHAANLVAHETEGFSSREIATKLIPTILRRSNRAPDGDIVRQAAREILPTSRSQSEQLEQIRRAAAGMRPAGRKGAQGAGPARSIG